MMLKQWLAIIGAMGVAAGAGGCAPKPANGEALPDAELVSQDTGVEKFLGKGGPVDQFNGKVVGAICQLEEKNKDRLDPTKRLCPTGDPEQVHKPTYPPQ